MHYLKKHFANRPSKRFSGITYTSDTKMAETPINELFRKMLLGQCTEAEVERIVAYLRQADTADDFPEIDEVRKLLAGKERMDRATANRIFDDIVAGQTKRPEKRFFFHRHIQLVAACAALLLLFVGGYFIFTIPRVTFQTAFGQLDSIKLDDGTLVKLNTNTEIRLHRDFTARSKRELWLDGEAFFEVAPLPGKPFVVHTKQGVDISVLGTAFNVNARKDETRVVLSNGSVRAQYKREAQWLSPGEMLRVTHGSPQMEKSVTDTLYHASWRYKLLAFKDEPLRHVANTIEDRYGYTLVFADEAIEKLRFTGSVPADNLELGLGMVALAFSLDIRQSGKTITIQTNNNNFN